MNNKITLATIFLVATILVSLTGIPYADAADNDHIVINEVDINPPGDDSASINEWVELYNPTDSEIDLGGWEIASTTVLKKTMTILNGTTIQPGEFLTYSYQSVWFTDSNESVELRDENGIIIDKTPLLSDLGNDFTSWQRFYDGLDTDSSADWKFVTSTAGSSNGQLVEEELTVTVEDGEEIAGLGKYILIKVSGAKQTVEFEIIASTGEIIQILSFPASDQGEINLPWLIPKDTPPGIYTVRATDAFGSAETTFELFSDPETEPPAEIGDILTTVKIDSNTPNGPVLVENSRLGNSIANIGDINGDGVNDIAVGTYIDNTVHIITLNASGYPIDTIEINDSTPNGPLLIDTNDRFGISIANIGDLDGNGIDDIAVGAYGDNAGGLNHGTIYIITLNASGYPITTVKIDSTTPNGPDLFESDLFGQSVANIGDIDGNGVNDIAVGAFRDDAAGSSAGAVHIITLNTTGYPINTIEINGTNPNGPILDHDDWFGYSIANIGDRNGDGIDAIAVGAFRDDDAGSSAGVVHIIQLNSDGTPKNTFKINGTNPNDPTISAGDNFGKSIANIGDINDDGFDDIAVGSNAGATEPPRGEINLILLNYTAHPLNTIKINSTTPNVPDSSDWFGSSVANIGDLDGNGINDIAVGAPMYFPETNKGEIYLMTLYGEVSPSKIPSFPQNLLVTPGNTLVNLTWYVPIHDGSSPLTDYIIEFGNGTAWTVFDDGVGTITNGTVTGLTNDQEYSFRVSAVNSVGTSIPSNVVVATPFVQLYCGKVLESFDNVIYGTDSSDFIQGTDGKDLIFGYGGNDLIDGLKQSDCIYAGDGNDFIQTGMGRDTVYGGNGDDTIRTSSGTNTVFGEEGNDIIYVADKNGFNTLDGGNGFDVCALKFENATASITNCEITE